VTASTAPGPKAWITAPTFPTQQATTIGPVQELRIANTGSEPLEISLKRVETLTGSVGDFIVAGDSCRDVTIAPGADCTLLVRFAPATVDTTSTARLVFADNSAEARRTVTITGSSTGFPQGDKGDQGAPGDAGAPGAPGAPGADGAAGVDGRDGAAGPAGADGAAGPAGPAGVTGAAGADGRDGAAGPAGEKGAKGDVGATGAKGATGARGRDALVTCKISGSSSVKCTVTYTNGSGKAARKAVKKTSRAALVRNGRIYAEGRVGGLKATRKVTRGRYTLRVGTQRFAVQVGR
jgi:hypothetical protein